MSTVSYIRDANGNLIRKDTVQVPANRDFRDSWVKDPNAPVIRVDMDRARDYFKDEAAKGALEVMRKEVIPEWIDADFAGDQTRKDAAGTRRANQQALLNSPAIDNAQTPEALKALWNASLLGVPPWDQGGA